MNQRWFGYVLPILMAWPASANGQPENNELRALVKQYSSQDLKKGEFETTDAYNARVESFVGRKFSVVVSTRRDLDMLGRKALSYDADTQTLTVQLVGNDHIKALSVVDSPSGNEGGTTPEARVMNGYDLLLGGYTKFYLTQSAPRKVREYTGSNAFGAKARVAVLLQEQTAMALSNVPDNLDAKFPKATVQIATSEARQALNDAKWRLEVETVLLPRQKNFVLDDGFYHAPTIDDPTESAIDGKTVMVKLDRAELFNSRTGKVYCAFDPATFGQSLGSAPVAASLQTSVAAPSPPTRLGVHYAPLNSAQIALLRVPSDHGLYVGAVEQGSPAAQAGVMPGDVITRFAGHEMAGASDLPMVVSSVTPGAVEPIHIWRLGGEIDLSIRF